MNSNKKKLIITIILILLALYLYDSVPEKVADTDYPVQASETVVQDSKSTDTVEEQTEYTFRSIEARDEHYEKHGIEMGFDSPEAYEAAASAVVNNPACLHKLEEEDGDDVYYLESTNELVIVSTWGSIRTYFKPERGIDYYNSQ